MPLTQGCGPEGAKEKGVLQGFGADNQGFQGRHHQKKAFLAKNAILWPKIVILGPGWSEVGPRTLYWGCWTHKSLLCRVLEHMIKGFGATITKKPHFLPKKC